MDLESGFYQNHVKVSSLSIKLQSLNNLSIFFSHALY